MRAATEGEQVSERTAQHSALDARDDLLAVAATWPDLVNRLARWGSSASDGMPKGRPDPSEGSVIDMHVSKVCAEIRDWVAFLARVLVDETDWTLPARYDTGSLAAAIARQRVGHFTAHPDVHLRLAFFDDATRMRKLAEKTAYPDGYRTLDTRVPCEEHGTSPAGERIVCPGVYKIRPRVDGSMPDMICSVDSTHRIRPEVWSRVSWKARHEDVEAG